MIKNNFFFHMILPVYTVETSCNIQSQRKSFLFIQYNIKHATCQRFFKTSYFSLISRYSKQKGTVFAVPFSLSFYHQNLYASDESSVFFKSDFIEFPLVSECTTFSTFSSFSIAVCALAKDFSVFTCPSVSTLFSSC